MAGLQEGLQKGFSILQCCHPAILQFTMSDWDEMAVVGRVARPHGLRGQVIVNVETDFPHDRFREGAELFLKRGGKVESVAVTSVRFQRDRPIISLDGIDDIDAAAALAGGELRVPVSRLAALPEGTFYRHDLVGCSVETDAGTHLGSVTDVEGTLGRSRLVVDTPDGELLVPLAADICRTIDPAGRRIVIRPLEGLLDLNQNRRT
jgi:16S rRNA processing protein RimM